MGLWLFEGLKKMCKHCCADHFIKGDKGNEIPQKTDLINDDTWPREANNRETWERQEIKYVQLHTFIHNDDDDVAPPTDHPHITNSNGPSTGEASNQRSQLTSTRHSTQTHPTRSCHARYQKCTS